MTPPKTASIGFVGLGVMGAPMAAHLLNAGHALTVWNRTRSKAEPLREQGARVAEDSRELARKSDIVFMSVSRTEDVAELVEIMAPEAWAGTIFVDHSTIDPAAAKILSRTVTDRACGFLDCPVTGGEKGAIEGSLTIFCGGSQQDFNRAKPFMRAYASTVRLVGPSGSGQMMKLANQISVALCVLAMAECLAFAKKTGLDLRECIELIGAGAGGSWSLTNYGPKALARDWTPGFSVRLQQKDLEYALGTAREVGLSLPGTKLVHDLFAVLEQQGRGGDATPALFEVIERMSDRQEE